MAPEQARGEPTDPRADVFALGGLLAAVLTGKAVFYGRSVADTVERAAVGDTADVLARLRACGADAELVDVAVACLQVHREDRPADGMAVAARVAAYRAGVEERLRKAEAERAATAAKEVERQKRKRVQLALAGAVGLLVVAGAGFAWWQGEQTDRHDRESALRQQEQEFKSGQAREMVSADLALATRLRQQFRFKEAEATLEQAERVAAADASDLTPQVAAARRDLRTAARLDDIRYRSSALFVPVDDTRQFPDRKVAYTEYPLALAEYGLDPRSGDPTATSDAVRQSAIRDELVAALDDWATWEPDQAARDRLLAAADGCVSNPWLHRLRTPAGWENRAALDALAADIDWATVSPHAVVMLVALMERQGGDVTGVVNAARTRFPDSFTLAFAGISARGFGKNPHALGAAEAARALRPDNPFAWDALGVVYYHRKEYDAAELAVRRAISLNADKPARHFNNLGLILRAKGNPVAATDAHRACQTLEPNNPIYMVGVATCLYDRQDYAGAIALCREAIAADERYALAHSYLGLALKARGDLPGAIVAYKDAVRFDRTDPHAHTNLCNALRLKGEYPQAVSAGRRAVELAPDSEVCHTNLGLALHMSGDIPGAIAEYEKALELNPRHALAHHNYAWAHKMKGDYDTAIRSYKMAIKCDPKQATSHYNLGGIYFDQKKYTDAIACANGAIDANPKYANAYALLGESLLRAGDVPGARAALTTAAKLDKKWQPKLALLPPLEILPAPRPAPER